MTILRALLGLAFFCVAARIVASGPRRASWSMPWRVIAGGVGLQVLLAWAILETRPGRAAFDGMAALVTELVSKARPGAELVFGSLADPQGPLGFVFAFGGSALPVIIFFSALMAVLYHLGVMQVVVYLMARVMTRTMGVSGAESISMAANVFVGQTEAPLVVRPYIARMTRSELNALMTGGFATIAGSVLAVYMGILGTEYGPHLLSASVMSAPAAFLIAKIMVPESEEPVTGRRVELRIERTAHNVIEAAANGTSEGLRIWLSVIAMLIAFMGLVAVIDWPLGWLGETLGLEGGLSLGRLLGFALAPVAWLIGVEGWHDCQLFGSLLGIKVALNEFVAFATMQPMLPGGEGDAFEHARSAKMAAYALCGFANFASIGIQIGGIGVLVPERRTDLARLALRAMVGGAFASWTTATVAGVFL